MSSFMRRSRGHLVTGLSLVTVLLVAACTEPPLAPGESHADATPVAELSSTFDQFQFLGFVEDDQGANDTPAQSDLNAFSRADNVTATIGVKWMWDDINSWTGAGQTGDGCALFDTDGDTKANAAVCVRISNPGGDPNVVSQLTPPASPLVYTCGDSKSDRCASPARLASSLGGTICEVEKVDGETIFTDGEDGADVLAACSIPYAAISAGATANVNLLNVCSFPSGSPNSNPFDCVVTPGAGFVVIRKATTPQSSGLTFSFTTSPALVVGASHSIKDSTSGVEETGLLSANPGTYSIAEGSLPGGWNLSSASCARQTTPTPTPTGTLSGNTISGISVTSGETTVCTFTNSVSAPSITVVKTGVPSTVAETGGNVTYTVTVTNGSTIPVTLTSLIDDRFGDLDGQGTCNKASSPANPYGSIAVGGTYSCTFTQALGPSEAAQTHINTVTANVTSDGGPASATDTAKVTFTDVLPDITVAKSADIETITAQGGTSVAGFDPDQTFNASGGGGGGTTTPSYYGATCDDEGANDEPAQSDLNCFSRADNVSGRLYIKFSWDDINSWTGAGQTGDGCSLLDTDNNGNADFAFCVRITNPNGDPSVIAQVEGSPILYKCGDDSPDRCSSKSSVVSHDESSVCSVSSVAQQLAGGEDGADIEAVCDLRLRDLGPTVTISNVDLLNVCSFPSGSPNSNPFDCVITPGAGFLVITEVATPSSLGAYFAFTLGNGTNTGAAAATNGDDKFAVQAGASSSAIPMIPGTYSVTQQMPTNWNLVSIACTRDGQSVGTTSGGTRLGVTIVKGQTTECTFTNALVASATVTFTVTVTNNSLESVTLFSLEDTENPTAGTPTYATLNGVGTCVTGGSIAGNGGTYSCTFTRTVSGTPGTQHKDRVRAVGRDNEVNSDTEVSGIVTVTIQ